MIIKRLINIALFILLLPVLAYSQSVRHYINKGVDQYKDGKVADAEVNFKKGLEQAPKNYVANFNLGDAYYKQQKFDNAIKSYEQALAESKTNGQRASVYHNIGNALLKDKKIDQSIEAYKKALKLNPDDPATKYNLSYALSQKNDQKNKQNKNQDKDKNKDKNKNDKDKNNKDQQNKNDKDKNKNDQNKDQKQNQDQQNKNKQDQKNQKQQQPQKNQISKADAERILAALKNNEKDLQKKLRKRTGKVVKTDKDW